MPVEIILTILILSFLVFPAAPLFPLVENDPGLGRLLQAGHEFLHVFKAVV